MVRAHGRTIREPCLRRRVSSYRRRSRALRIPGRLAAPLVCSSARSGRRASPALLRGRKQALDGSHVRVSGGVLMAIRLARLIELDELWPHVSVIGTDHYHCTSE